MFVIGVVLGQSTLVFASVKLAASNLGHSLSYLQYPKSFKH